MDPFHPDAFIDSGETIIFQGRATTSSRDDIAMITKGKGDELIWLIRGPANESNAEISPDGRWLAYMSDESGQNEIYVRPFPNVDDNRWQLSNRGGSQPLWSSDGRELFYIEQGAPNSLVSVVVEPADDELQAIGRSRIMNWPYVGSFNRSYDVSSDGQRFLAVKPLDAEDEQAKIVVVQNWFEELKRLVPTE